ncbi:hypothetical protein [Leptolyngbya sp. 'hensonii']|nr:hypothetical protein [Leptolyngbya sp. 'hensonii']
MLSTTLIVPGSTLYILVKLCVLALALILWWVVASHSSMPIV